MAGIYLAPTSFAQPPSVYVPPTGSRMFWHGFDGSTWALTDPASGVRLGRGVQGLSMPDMDWFTTDSAGVDGTQDRGFRVLPRDVLWPVQVYQRQASQAWNIYDSSFWRTLYPGRYGDWEVVQPSGESRRLTCRFHDDGNHVFGDDPTLTGWAQYDVRLVASLNPYWTSTVPVVRSWSNGTSQPFFGGNSGGGFGPPFYISTASTISTATMPNPGDTDAWPVWTIFGPTTSVDVGLNGSIIQAHFTVASGKALVIDTDPRAQTAMDANIVTVAGQQTAVLTGTELTGSLGSTDFAPIPTGTQVTLSLSLTGTGSVQASISPRWYRAW